MFTERQFVVNNFKERRSSNYGYSLAELLIVVVVMGVLMLVGATIMASVEEAKVQEQVQIEKQEKQEKLTKETPSTNPPEDTPGISSGW
jgi:prepilin-type N-terminal cleavage/methylation domain-containing protein